MFGIRMPRFLRRFIRKHTMAMAEEDAMKWKAGLSVVYMIICWNIAGLAVYQLMKPKKHSKLSEKEAEQMNVSSAAYYAHLLNVQNPKVLRHKGGLSFETEEVDVSNVQEVQELKDKLFKEQVLASGEGIVDMTKENATENIFKGE